MRDMAGVYVTFEAAPALKYAENLELYSPENSIRAGRSFAGSLHANFDSFISPGVGLRMRAVPSKSSSATAPHFRVIKAERRWHTHFSGAFGRRIIELLKDSARELTFRMTAREFADELRLDESDYIVDVHKTTTRYTSEKTGIIVEVKGRSIAIQSTAGIPHKKTEGVKK
ncbi:hypothetical protein AAVH_18333 [Aphelenchoides avenae]|nr:hypothetical protein AAVH_18333 [Aphelenchus avenae]